MNKEQVLTLRNICANLIKNDISFVGTPEEQGNSTRLLLHAIEFMVEHAVQAEDCSLEPDAWDTLDLKAEASRWLVETYPNEDFNAFWGLLTEQIGAMQ